MVPETAFLCRAYDWVFLEIEFSETDIVHEFDICTKQRRSWQAF